MSASSNKFIDIYDVKGTPIASAPVQRKGLRMRFSGAAVLIAVGLFAACFVVAGLISGWNW